MTENEGYLTGKMTGTTKSDLIFRHLGHLGMGWDLLWVWSCHRSGPIIKKAALKSIQKIVRMSKDAS